jgi:hypothetical protein
MGIATGEAELRDGDYFGAVLNRAARVMAAGHGGQILVAESTVGLLSGVKLVDLAARRLRDLPAPGGGVSGPGGGPTHGLSAAAGTGCESGEPRPAVTSFIGRESEVAELQGAMKAHRLMTLTGAGGVGKTRLAQEGETIHLSFPLKLAYPNIGVVQRKYAKLPLSRGSGQFMVPIGQVPAHPEAHVAEHTDLGVLVLALERDIDTAPTSPIMMLRELRCGPC